VLPPAVLLHYQLLLHLLTQLLHWLVACKRRSTSHGEICLSVQGEFSSIVVLLARNI
jgi:hypothetical protein